MATQTEIAAAVAALAKATPAFNAAITKPIHSNLKAPYYRVEPLVVAPLVLCVA